MQELKDPEFPTDTYAYADIGPLYVGYVPNPAYNWGQHKLMLRYWERDGEEWSFKVADIAREFGVSPSRLVHFLQETFNWDVFWNYGCGHGITVASRADYPKAVKEAKNGCPACNTPQEEDEQPLIDALNTLDKAAYAALVAEYYQGVDCQLLVEKYQLPPVPSNFPQSPPWGWTLDVKCKHCDKQLRIDRIGQTQALSGEFQALAKCKQCGHEAQFDCTIEVVNQHAVLHRSLARNQSCQCHGCTTDPRTLINEKYVAPQTMVGPDQLGLRAMIGLLGLLWARTNSEAIDPNLIFPESDSQVPLMYGEGQWDLMRTTSRGGAIYVDGCASPGTAFKKGDIHTYYLDRVAWRTNITLDGQDRASFPDLIYRFSALFGRGYWQDSWTDDLLPLWKDMAVGECLEYAKFKADFYNLPMPSEDKLREILLSLLDTYSVSDCWYFISTAFMSAAAFYQSQKAKSKQHAANTVPSKIIALADQPREKIKSFDRIQEIPKCAVSEVLFNLMFGLQGDPGFDLCPRTNWARLLEKHLSRVPAATLHQGMQDCPLASDMALEMLDGEFQDERISQLVQYAIAARKYINALERENKELQGQLETKQADE